MNWVVLGVLITTVMLLSGMVRAFLRGVVESFLIALRAADCLGARIVLELSPTTAIASAHCVSSQIGARIPSAPRAPPLLHREGLALPSKDPALKLNPLGVGKTKVFLTEAQAFERSDVSWQLIF